MARMLLGRNVDINAINDSTGGHLWLTAVSNRHVETAKMLLEAGADISVVDEYDNTLLSLAVDRGVEEIVKILLNRNVDVNVVNGIKRHH